MVRMALCQGIGAFLSESVKRCQSRAGGPSYVTIGYYHLSWD